MWGLQVSCWCLLSLLLQKATWYQDRRMAPQGKLCFRSATNWLVTVKFFPVLSITGESLAPLPKFWLQLLVLCHTLLSWGLECDTGPTAGLSLAASLGCAASVCWLCLRGLCPPSILAPSPTCWGSVSGSDQGSVAGLGHKQVIEVKLPKRLKY